MDTRTRQEIPNDEIMMLSLLKINPLSNLGDDVLITEVMLLDSDPQNITAVVRIQTNMEEYSGYSRHTHWESALSQAFDSIAQQVRLSDFPARENSN